MVACVTDRVAGARVLQAGSGPAARGHVGRVCTAQAVRSDAGVIITPHVTTSLAPACVQQAGEDHTVRKSVCLVGTGGDALSAASVLAALPVTM